MQFRFKFLFLFFPYFISNNWSKTSAVSSFFCDIDRPTNECVALIMSQSSIFHNVDRIDLDQGSNSESIKYVVARSVLCSSSLFLIFIMSESVISTSDRIMSRLTHWHMISPVLSKLGTPGTTKMCAFWRKQRLEMTYTQQEMQKLIFVGPWPRGDNHSQKWGSFLNLR